MVSGDKSILGQQLRRQEIWQLSVHCSVARSFKCIQFNPPYIFINIPESLQSCVVVYIILYFLPHPDFCRGKMLSSRLAGSLRSLLLVGQQQQQQLLVCQQLTCSSWQLPSFMRTSGTSSRQLSFSSLQLLARPRVNLLSIQLLPNIQTRQVHQEKGLKRSKWWSLRVPVVKCYFVGLSFPDFMKKIKNELWIKINAFSKRKSLILFFL